jgi:hypothetical protein
MYQKTKLALELMKIEDEEAVTVIAPPKKLGKRSLSPEEIAAPLKRFTTTFT